MAGVLIKVPADEGFGGLRDDPPTCGTFAGKKLKTCDIRPARASQFLRR
jgi:hypothetical protein